MCNHKKMDSSCLKISPIILALVFFQLFASSVCSVQSENYNNTNQKLGPGYELKKLKHAREYLKKINKHAVKTIQSPDGDLIDCVLSHLQPAFDHPQLQGQRPLMDPPEKPNWIVSRNKTFEESFQLWRKSGESCPENTIPIRRTTEQDVIRASSVRTFGRKIVVRKDAIGNGHEHAIGFVNSEQYYGAGATINVWAPHVQEKGEFSISQIWLTADSDCGQNTIEVGWQVEPDMYGDGLPRLFTYWTSDGYQKTGCYNLLCSGFIQTSDKIALGAAIWPVSSYDVYNKQYDIQMSVYKDKDYGNWWVAVNGNLLGYWPSTLFTSLGDHANMIEFGGEIVNTRSGGTHTSTQMGSGHFAGGRFGRTSYFRYMQVINSRKAVVNVSNLHLRAENEHCYSITTGDTYYNVWGTYIFYGGPGRSARCP